MGIRAYQKILVLTIFFGIGIMIISTLGFFTASALMEGQIKEIEDKELFEDDDFSKQQDFSLGLEATLKPDDTLSSKLMYSRTMFDSVLVDDRL